MDFECAKKAKISLTTLAFFFFCLVISDCLSAQDIRIFPENLKREKGGMILVGLYNSAAGFPDNPAKILKSVSFRPSDSFVLQDIPPGRYALVLLHDLDGNKKMTYSFMGIPRDGFSSSPDGGSPFSKPVFEKASFQHGEKGTVLKLKFHYLP